MNNKGFYSIFSLMVMFSLIVVGVCLISNDALRSINVDPVPINITWTPIKQTTQGENIYVNEIIVFIYAFINFIGYWCFEFAKLLSAWAIQHPEVNGNLLIKVVIFLLLIPFIYPLFIITVSLILIIQEYFVKRAEKKRYLNEKHLTKEGKSQ